MSRRDSNEQDGCTMTAAPNVAAGVCAAIEKQFRRAWMGPPTAYLSYLNGTELESVVYVTFSLDVVGHDAVNLALGALQHQFAEAKRFGAPAPADLSGMALVWRTKPEITDGKLWFRLGVIPAHIVQVLLTPSD